MQASRLLAVSPLYCTSTQQGVPAGCFLQHGSIQGAAALHAWLSVDSSATCHILIDSATVGGHDQLALQPSSSKRGGAFALHRHNLPLQQRKGVLHFANKQSA